MSSRNKKHKYTGVDSLRYVEKIQKREGFKNQGKKLERTYSEGLYYSKVILGAVLFATVVSSFGIVSYLRMPESAYYTTDYKGDVRSLIPKSREPRD